MTSFQQLLDIVKKLRGPDGCPWDKEQTHESLTPYAIEEAYELEEAIQNKDIANIKEELGDLLFQTVLHCEIASQEGSFDIDEVIQILNHKMTTRHPHVFSNVKVENSKEVLKNWEDIKAQEKPKDVFEIPQSFPALLRAHKIGKRTKRLDFDWDTTEEVILKLKEELLELEMAIKNKDQQNIEEEMGDLLFTSAQLARHLDLDAEKTLRLANTKFVNRFLAMVEKVKDFKSLPRDKKESLWNQVKKN